MTVQFGEPVPDDILMEWEVDKAIRGGHPVPRWGWPVPGPYNGATGRERIVAWQKVRVAELLGLIGRPRDCGLCRKSDAPHRHAEIYFRGLTSKPVCRSCHFHIHRRFARPNDWRAMLNRYPDAHGWVKGLRLTELSREEAMSIARHPDVFAAMAAEAINPNL